MIAAGGDAAGAIRMNSGRSSAHTLTAPRHFSLGAVYDQQGKAADACRVSIKGSCAVRANLPMRTCVSPSPCVARERPIRPSRNSRRRSHSIRPWRMPGSAARGRCSPWGGSEQAREWITRGKSSAPECPEWIRARVAGALTPGERVAGVYLPVSQLTARVRLSHPQRRRPGVAVNDCPRCSGTGWPCLPMMRMQRVVMQALV